MEARIAVASLVVFAGVLTAGMVVTSVNGGDGPSTEFAESDLRVVADESPTRIAETGAFATVELHGDQSPSRPYSDDDRFEDDDHDDDRYEEDWDDDDWDDDHEGDHRDEHDDDDEGDREDDGD